MNDIRSWRKPVQEIIARNETFWNGLHEVDHVYVLGFSCGSVDLPYIKKIVSVVSPDTEWLLTWYKEKERVELPATLYSCGVKNVSPITWNSLESTSMGTDLV